MAYATFFDGLLSADRKLNDLYEKDGLAPHQRLPEILVIMSCSDVTSGRAIGPYLYQNVAIDEDPRPL